MQLAPSIRSHHDHFEQIFCDWHGLIEPSADDGAQFFSGGPVEFDGGATIAAHDAVVAEIQFKGAAQMQTVVLIIGSYDALYQRR